MRFQDLTRVAAFVVGSTASAINARIAASDDCGSAVASMSSAQADCSSNVVLYTVVTVLVTPTALTVTETSNYQETAFATLVETDTELTTLTSDVLTTRTDIAYETTYSASYEVITVTVPTLSTPPPVTATVVSTITVQPTSTIYSYYPTAAAAKKRDAELDMRSTVDDEEEVCEVYVEEVWVDVPGPTMSSMEPTSSSSSVEPVSSTSSLEVTSSSSSAEPSSTSSIESSSSSESAEPTSTIESTSTSEIVEPTSTVESTTSTESSSVTSYTSSIPTYASACTSWTDYVTACSSVGVSQVTSIVSLTLEPETVTVIISSTETLLQTSTASTDLILEATALNTIVASTISTSTITLPTVIETVQTVYQTSTIAASTILVTQTSTVSGTSAAVATVASALRPFKLMMVPLDTSRATVYLTTGTGNGIVYTGTTLALAKTFVLDTLNRLVTTDTVPQIACSRNSIASYYMNSLTAAGVVTYAASFTPLKCVVASDLTLTCPVGTGASFTMYPANGDFFYGAAGFNSYPTYIAHIVYV